MWDGLIIGRLTAQLQHELTLLQKSFKLMIQPLTSFLGIEIKLSRKGIFIHQQKYIEDLLNQYGMADCKTQDIPMLPGLQLEGSKPPNTNYDFQELI